jgi:hypothetical protein
VKRKCYIDKKINNLSIYTRGEHISNKKSPRPKQNQLFRKILQNKNNLKNNSKNGG